MSRKVHLLALALAAAAVAAPIAQADTGPSTQPKVDPLAVSYLRGQGFSPSQVEAWTVGACSYEAKPASCYASPVRTAEPAKVDPLAVSYLREQGLSPHQIKALTVGIDPLAASYLRGQGLSPNQVRDWSVGACSYEEKPAGCFSSAESAAAAETIRSGGFDWADAGIGAGATLGIVLLFAGLGAVLVMSRQNRRQQVPSM